MTITIVVPSSLVDPAQQRRTPRATVAAVELAGRLVGEERPRARWRAPRRSRRAAARRRTAAPAGGRARSARPTRLEQLRRPRARVLRPAVEDHRQLDVLDRRQVRQQVAGRLLPDEPDDPAPVARPLAPAHRGRGRGRRRPPARPTGRRARRGCSAASTCRCPTRRRSRSSRRRRREIEALERDDLEVGDLVDLHEVVADDQRALAVARPALAAEPGRERRGRGGARPPRGSGDPPRDGDGSSSICGPASLDQADGSWRWDISRTLVVRRRPGPRSAGAPRPGRCRARRW